MLTAGPAFGEPNAPESAVFAAVAHHCAAPTEHLSWPRSVPAEARAIVEALLVCDPSRRLHTAEAVKAHPFFAGVDWTAVRERRYMAPWIPPPMRFPGDVANFDIYLRMEGETVCSRGAASRVVYEKPLPSFLLGRKRTRSSREGAADPATVAAAAATTASIHTEYSSSSSSGSGSGMVVEGDAVADGAKSGRSSAETAAIVAQGCSGASHRPTSSLSPPPPPTPPNGGDFTLSPRSRSSGRGGSGGGGSALDLPPIAEAHCGSDAGVDFAPPPTPLLMPSTRVRGLSAAAAAAALSRRAVLPTIKEMSRTSLLSSGSEGEGATPPTGGNSRGGGGDDAGASSNSSSAALLPLAAGDSTPGGPAQVIGAGDGRSSSSRSNHSRRSSGAAAGEGEEDSGSEGAGNSPVVVLQPPSPVAVGGGHASEA